MAFAMVGSFELDQSRPVNKAGRICSDFARPLVGAEARTAAGSQCLDLAARGVGPRDVQFHLSFDDVQLSAAALVDPHGKLGPEVDRAIAGCLDRETVRLRRHMARSLPRWQYALSLEINSKSHGPSMITLCAIQNSS